MSMGKVLELSREIGRNERKAAKSLKELQRSLILRSIWPDAWQDGPCKTWGRIDYTAGPRYRDLGYIFLCFEAGNGVRFYMRKYEVLLWQPDAQFSKKWDTYPANVAGGGIQS